MHKESWIRAIASLRQSLKNHQLSKLSRSIGNHLHHVHDIQFDTVRYMLEQRQYKLCEWLQKSSDADASLGHLLRWALHFPGKVVLTDLAICHLAAS